MRISSLADGDVSLTPRERSEGGGRTAKLKVVEVSEFSSRVAVTILHTELCAKLAGQRERQRGRDASIGISDFGG